MRQTNEHRQVLASFQAYTKRRGLRAVCPLHQVGIYWRATVSGPKGTTTVWTATFPGSRRGQYDVGRWHLNQWTNEASRAKRREQDAARRVKRAEDTCKRNDDHTYFRCYKVAMAMEDSPERAAAVLLHSDCREAKEYWSSVTCPASRGGHLSDGDGHCQRCGRAE